MFVQQYIGNEKKGNEIREESVQKIASMTWGHKKYSHLPVYVFETQSQSSFPTNPLKCSQTPFFKKLLPHFSGSLNSTHLIAAIENQQKKSRTDVIYEKCLHFGWFLFLLLMEMKPKDKMNDQHNLAFCGEKERNAKFRCMHTLWFKHSRSLFRLSADAMKS